MLRTFARFDKDGSGFIEANEMGSLKKFFTIDEVDVNVKDGKIDLILSDEKGNKNKLASRGPGDVLGELSLLLGHDASVSAIANGPVSVIEVKSAALLGMLREDPVQSGRLFKVIATYLSERISELSSKMRANVTSQSASQQQAASQAVLSADVAKARQMFQRPKDEKLLGIYQCSVRRELNAVKEARARNSAQFVRNSAAAARTLHATLRPPSALRRRTPTSASSTSSSRTCASTSRCSRSTSSGCSR